MNSSLLLLFTTALLLITLCHAATQSSQQQQQQYNTRSTARRERNLDHWDADTLAYYLGIDEATGKLSPSHDYPGHDAAVLFYAQWCQNCHAFAPTWDAIATHLNAGTTSSRLVMAVFDCEYNARHSKLCSAAGVLHYPTLLFMGDGTFHDSDLVTKTILGKKRSAGPAGPSPIPHTVKFQGQLQYADSVLDWIRLMQGFSKWHQWTSSGILHYVRNGLLGFLRPQRLQKRTKTESLPVGVPPSALSTSTTTTSSSSNTAANTPPPSMDTALLESKLNKSEEDAKLMEKAATHAGYLLDAILFPPTYKNTTSDAFAVMSLTQAWDSTSSENDAVKTTLRTCTLELSLDYCSRLSTHITNLYLEEMVNATEFPSMADIEVLLKDRVATQEAYCGLFDECLKENFLSPKCRPNKCPFQDAGCRYVSACLDPTIQREYAIALELITEEDEFPPKQAHEQEEEETTTNKKKKGSWGF